MKTGFSNCRSVLSAAMIGVLLASCGTEPAPAPPVDGAPRGSTPPPSAEPSSVTVRVAMDRKDRFFPDVIAIRPGDTVEWINNSDRLHAVTNDPASAIRADDVGRPAGTAPFDSGYVEPGKTYRQRFTQEGEYRYVCFLHETGGMVGTVLVSSKGGP